MDQTQAKHLVESLQGKNVGGWAIDGFFGNGKSAVVLPAVRNGQEGAIKIFHPELVERYGKRAQLQRIHREITLIGAEHPNLVRILDGGECLDSGHLYVVMERLRHPNLHSLLGKVPLAAVPKLISQVASAARFLEDRGLVHRDIKPENIAVTPDFTRAILMDLGVLRPIGLQELTDIDQRLFIGTLRYSSPEFLLRMEEDSVEGWRAVTFYQLGAVLHDMLMGRVLFEEYSEPFSRLVDAVRSVVPQIYSEDARSATLAKHCLVKNPRTRLELVTWTSFSEIASDEAPALTSVRERIRKRQRYFQDSCQDGIAPSAQERQTIRHLLADLCNRFESRVAALMNELQCFPLRTTRSVQDVDEGRCTTCVHFQRDQTLGLLFDLTIKFEISILDLNNGTPICKAAAAAALSDGNLLSAHDAPSVPFFTGEIQAFLDSQLIAQQFLSALEAAYESIDQGKAPSKEVPLQLTLLHGGSKS